MPAPTPLLGVTGGPPVTPGRLPLRHPDQPGASPGWSPLPITDGFYVSWATPSMTDEPLWVRTAGHLEEA